MIQKVPGKTSSASSKIRMNNVICIATTPRAASCMLGTQCVHWCTSTKTRV